MPELLSKETCGDSSRKWRRSCKATDDVIAAHTVVTAVTDFDGTTTMQAPPGDYFVLGHFSAGKSFVTWVVPITLKPGKNTLVLDHANAVSVASEASRAIVAPRSADTNRNHQIRSGGEHGDEVVPLLRGGNSGCCDCLQTLQARPATIRTTDAYAYGLGTTNVRLLWVPGMCEDGACRDGDVFTLRGSAHGRCSTTVNWWHAHERPYRARGSGRSAAGVSRDTPRCCARHARQSATKSSDTRTATELRDVPPYTVEEKRGDVQLVRVQSTIGEENDDLMAIARDIQIRAGVAPMQVMFWEYGDVIGAARGYGWVDGTVLHRTDPPFATVKVWSSSMTLRRPFGTVIERRR